MPRAWLGFLLVAAAAALAGCGVSERRARAVAEASSGVDLTAAEATTYRTGSTTLYAFAISDAAGRNRREYRVDARTGSFVGWLARIERLPGGDLPDFDRECATGLARECARGLLGDAVDSMSWSEAEAGGRVATVRGVSPPAGAPPRDGLGPTVVAVVRSDGVVTSYRQYVPPARDRVPRPVRLDDTDARALAAADFPIVARYPRCDTNASLSQRAGEAVWRVVSSVYEEQAQGDVPGPTAILTWSIDARSGRILERGLRIGQGAPHGLQAFARKVGANDATRFWNTRWPSRPLGCAGAGLALALFGGFLIRRRRPLGGSGPAPEPDPVEAGASSWFED